VRIALRVLLAIGLVVALVAVTLAAHRPFPADTTPEGAYLRIAKSIDEDQIAGMFAYLETDAQWASHTLRDERAKACARIRASYPKAEAEELLRAYAPLGDAKGGADVFALLARQKGWVTQLRRDMSGVAKVEVVGERASVVTVRGTRYPFRRRDNGIWGLTLFSAELLTEAERASRDLAVVNAAADDYDRASPTPLSSSGTHSSDRQARPSPPVDPSATSPAR
jgi:hypothetical protein